MKQTLVCVVWNDAHGSTTMFDETDVEHKPYKFTSVGLLVRSDEVGVSLAREIGDDNRFRDHEFIPRAMVVDEWVIGPLTKPRKRKPLAMKPKLEEQFPAPDKPNP